MKKITFIAAAALPLLSLVSCGEKETPAAPATTEAAAESPAAPATTEAAAESPAAPATTEAAAESPAAPVTTEAAAESPAAPVTTEAAAESPAAPVTAEDPFVALVETMEQFATTLEATTPENSAEQAKKIKEIAAKMPELFAKLAEIGPDATPSPDVNSRGEAAEARIEAWFEANVTNLGSYDPSFTEALESIEM